MRLRTIVAGVMLLHSLPLLAQTNVVTNPVGSQDIVQPVNTQTSTNNLGGIRYVTAIYRWSQSPVADLSVAGAGKTITLAPCPLGIDTSAGANKPYYVYISTQGTPEAALVTGGTCTGGAASGTVIVTTVNAHSAGYTVGSAYAGIQEAINDAGTPGAYVKVLPSKGQTNNSWDIYAPIIEQNTHSVLDGGGAALNCRTRSRCIQIGSLANSNSFDHISVKDFVISTSLSATGVAVTNTACSTNVATITTAANTFVTGDYVDIQLTGNKNYWGIHQITVTDSTHFTFAKTGCSIGSVADVGFAALENAGIEDSINHANIENISFRRNAGVTGLFNNDIVVDNDQAAVLSKIDSYNTQCSAGSYCGQAVYAPGPFATSASVIYLNDSQISLQCGGNGVNDLAGNTIALTNTVVQGFQQFAFQGGTLLGGFGGTTSTNIYDEVGSCANPLYPGSGLQQQAQAGFLSWGNVSIRGGESPIGNMPQFAATGNSGTRYNYCVVVKDSVEGTSTCLPAGYALVDSVTPTGSITVAWPRVQGTATVTYDILRYSGTGNLIVAPYNGGCAGGSTTACGSRLLAQAQCSSVICTATDTASANTTSYAVATPNYYPQLNFWPGGLVLSVSGDALSDSQPPVAFVESLGFITNVSPLVSVGGINTPTVFTQRCDKATPGVWVDCTGGNPSGASNPTVGAWLPQNGPANGGSITANVKGRINLLNNPNVSIINGDLFTGVDSNPWKTIATGLFRPTADANDTALCLDNANVAVAFAQLCLRAPVSISQYIATLGDGTSWLERLTATLKTFKVPITTNSQITSTLATGTAPLAIASTTSVANLTVSNHPKVQGCGTTTACSHSALTGGQIVFGQVALSAGLATVTGISPAFTMSTTFQCTASDRTTAGNAANAVPASTNSITVRGTSTDVISYICVGN